MKFKIGDIIKVYGTITDNYNADLQFYCRGHKAKVIFAWHGGEELTVKMLKDGTTCGGTETEVHPMQCRKVKKNARKT